MATDFLDILAATFTQLDFARTPICHRTSRVGKYQCDFAEKKLCWIQVARA